MKSKLVSIFCVVSVLMLISGCSTKEQKIEPIPEKQVASGDLERKLYDANGNLVSEVLGIIDSKVDKYLYEYYTTNQLKRKTRYLDHLKHGEAKAYYQNGNIYQDELYKNGKKDGVQRAYYENGNLQYESSMMNDKFYGFSKTYYSNAKQKSIINYNRYEQVVYIKTFRLDGKVLKDMRRGSGVENIYFDSGELQFQTTYFKGVKTKQVEYSENGKIKKQISYL